MFAHLAMSASHLSDQEFIALRLVVKVNSRPGAPFMLGMVSYGAGGDVSD